MSYNTDYQMEDLKSTEIKTKKDAISDQEAEEAFKTIIKWLGENPDREGLKDTPKRAVKAFKEYFKGYKLDAKADLKKTFGDVKGS